MGAQCTPQLWDGILAKGNQKKAKGGGGGVGCVETELAMHRVVPRFWQIEC